MLRKSNSQMLIPARDVKRGRLYKLSRGKYYQHEIIVEALGISADGTIVMFRHKNCSTDEYWNLLLLRIDSLIEPIGGHYE